MTTDTEMATHVKAAEAAAVENSWVGVDLDGTLAEWHGWTPEIGAPVPRMVEIIKGHLAAGETVKVFTARATEPHRAYWQEKIGDWTEKHVGQRLEITDRKDAFLTRFYDDRCIQIVENTGMPVMAIPGVFDAVQRFKRDELLVKFATQRKPA